MIDAILGPYKWLLYAAIIAAVVGSAYYAKTQYDNEKIEQGAKPWRDKFNALADAVAKQKVEAVALLKAETAKNEKISQSWVDYAKRESNDYEAKLAAIRNTPIGGGLYDPDARRWQSSNCPASGQGNTPTPENASTSGQLSDQATAFLYAQAKLADEVAEYAMSCYRYVNKLEP